MTIEPLRAPKGRLFMTATPAPGGPRDCAGHVKLCQPLVMPRKDDSSEYSPDDDDAFDLFVKNSTLPPLLRQYASGQTSRLFSSRCIGRHILEEASQSTHVRSRLRYNCQ